MPAYRNQVRTITLMSGAVVDSSHQNIPVIQATDTLSRWLGVCIAVGSTDFPQTQQTLAALQQIIFLLQEAVITPDATTPILLRQALSHIEHPKCPYEQALTLSIKK
ncbi:MAG: hypothetical protein Q4A55_01920 [Aerococcus sp.]|nr:hypothetical protein [Aerococcus sp.]